MLELQRLVQVRARRGVRAGSGTCRAVRPPVPLDFVVVVLNCSSPRHASGPWSCAPFVGLLGPFEELQPSWPRYAVPAVPALFCRTVSSCASTC